MDGAETWLLYYVGFDPCTEGVRETLCALGNGYLVTRGAAPETAADAVHYPGTYAAGVFNRLRSRVQGHWHEDESLVNLPNWLPLSWRVGGGPWVTPGGARVCDYWQSLDRRTGVLCRRYRVVDRRGRATSVRQRMLVSMAQPHLAALETTFVPENWSDTGMCAPESGRDRCRRLCDGVARHYGGCVACPSGVSGRHPLRLGNCAAS